MLVTRPARAEVDRWAEAMATAGAIVVPYPTIEVRPPPSWEPLDQALRQVGRYDWIIFTSKTAVLFTASRMEGGRFPTVPKFPHVAAVGAETARALEQAGAHVDLVPSDQRQEGLILAFRSLGGGARLLFPQALAGRDALIEALRDQGCQVDVVAAYQTAPLRPLPPPPAFDVATFASPSALRAFVETHGTRALANKAVAVIGPTTAAEATRHGLSPVVAEEPNIDALISAIVCARSPKGDH
ncbi:MAG TPA: uroporphyrinogen-III synthase [Polyangia bacterium]|nr:uroporphyrinogen-III synthase [Polyangia bacterium]